MGPTVTSLAPVLPALDLEQCREILGPDCTLSDAEVERPAAEPAGLAMVVVEVYGQSLRSGRSWSRATRAGTEASCEEATEKGHFEPP